MLFHHRIACHDIQFSNAISPVIYGHAWQFLSESTYTLRFGSHMCCALLLVAIELHLLYIFPLQYSLFT